MDTSLNCHIAQADLGEINKLVQGIQRANSMKSRPYQIIFKKSTSMNWRI